MILLNDQYISVKPVPAEGPLVRDAAYALSMLVLSASLGIRNAAALPLTQLHLLLASSHPSHPDIAASSLEQGLMDLKYKEGLIRAERQ